eukprot:7386355-Prymnesium_polylepis.1
MGRRDIGRRHKAGVGNNKKLPAAREIVQPAAKRPVDADGEVAEEPPPKRQRSEAARKQPRRGENKRPKPKPRGPPLRTPAQPPAAELLPDELEERRRRDRGYSKSSYEKQRDAATGELPPLPGPDVYRSTKTGRERKGGANAWAAGKKRYVDKIIDAVDDVGGTEELQSQALHDALEHPRLLKRARMAGYRPSEEVEVALFQQQQMARAVERAGSTSGKKRGRADDDRRSFVEAVQVAVAPSPVKEGAASAVKVPSRRARARALGQCESTARRQQHAAEKKRALLSKQEHGLAWSSVKKRKGYSKVTRKMRAALLQWVLDHPRVVESPLKETIKVEDPKSGEKVPTTKLLREVSIRELHNDLIELPVDEGGKGGGLPEARGEKGEVLISATAMRGLLPPQLQAMTERHKQMCGCEICISADQLQQSLNAFRFRLKRQLLGLVASEETDEAKRVAEKRAVEYQPTLNHTPPVPWHTKPGLALSEIQCPLAKASHFPHWNCVLGRCAKCPAYPIPMEEQGTDANAPKINLHVYRNVTECSWHGVLATNAKKCPECEASPPPAAAGSAKKRPKPPKIRTRKQLTQILNVPIGTFHAEYYLPALKKLAYHRPHCTILGKNFCGAERLAAFKRKPAAIRTRRDYAERLAAAFNLEIQCDHFGNGRSLSMEGSAVETFCASAVAALKNGVWQMSDDDLRMVFHSHLSDDSRQDAATTHAHMKALFKQLRRVGELFEGFVDYDDTDGCGK